MDEKIIRRSRICYIIEAALEYFISILVGGSYLATLTAELGISDGLTGVLSSFISLGCLFQLLSVFLKRPRVKKTVVSLSVLNQLLFMLLFFIPLINCGKTIRIVIFTAAIFTAYLIYNSVHPLKINWLMSLVEDGKRGIFTSHKEIVSLLSGMLFSFAAGSVIDRYKDAGRVDIAFVICGVAIFVLTVLHTVTMLLSVELPTDSVTAKQKNPVREMLGTLRDKSVVKITILFVLWHIASSSATPFYGTYLIKELGFSLKFVSVLTIIYSIVRAGVSTFWGKYADRKSFASMVRVCLIIAGAGFFVNIFTVPSNGKIFYTIYYIFYAVAMGGINSALTNLVFDYVAPETRSNALALSQSVSGVAGFLTTLAVSVPVTYIQKNGNTLFGINVYAQQAVSALAFVFVIAAVVYVTVAILPKKGRF